jgi:hypothetical protein
MVYGLDQDCGQARVFFPNERKHALISTLGQRSEEACLVI